MYVVVFQNKGKFAIPFPGLSQGHFKTFSHGTVDQKVGGGVDDEEPVVETDQTQVPVGGVEGVRTPEHLLHHEKLCTVEDHPGDVTEEEDDDNADQHCCQVHLATSTLFCFHVCKPKMTL